MTSSSPVRGWYPDANGQLRFWNGTAWTEHTAPSAADLPAVPVPPVRVAHRHQPDQGWLLRHKLTSVVSALAVLAVIAGVAVVLRPATRDASDATATPPSALPSWTEAEKAAAAARIAARRAAAQASAAARRATAARAAAAKAAAAKAATRKAAAEKAVAQKAAAQKTAGEKAAAEAAAEQAAQKAAAEKAAADQAAEAAAERAAARRLAAEQAAKAAEQQAVSVAAGSGRVYAGSGAMVLGITKGAGPMVATFTHQGGSAFTVTNVGRSGADIDLLVSVVGPYRGTVLFDARAGERTVAFKVQSVGGWTVSTRPVEDAPRWPAGQPTVSDHGDSVRLVSEVFDGGVSTARITHSGEGGFAVTSYGDRTDLLVNVTGRYEGDVRIPDGTVLLEVRADGPWAMTRTD